MMERRAFTAEQLNVYETAIALSNKEKLFDKEQIKDVIFNNPATIVLWKDGTKTVVKCQDGDVYNPETGLAMCIIKKMCGNKGNYFNIFREWMEQEE